MKIVLQDDDGKQIDAIGGMNREILQIWVTLLRETGKDND